MFFRITKEKNYKKCLQLAHLYATIVEVINIFLLKEWDLSPLFHDYLSKFGGKYGI